MQNDESLSNAALAAIHLLHKGFKIIPIYGVDANGNCLCGKSDCKPIGKHPMVNNWQNSYFASEDDVRRFWQHSPGSNYGIITKGLIVIDIDERNGGDQSFNTYISPYLNQKTFIVKTGSHAKSKHIYFKDSNCEFKNLNGLFQGVDVKADGGYVVGAHSKHKSGNFYEVGDMGSTDGKEIFISDLPNSLKSILKPASKNRFSSKTKNTIASTIFQSDVVEGSRNNTLTSYAGKLRRNGYDHEKAKILLIKSNNTFNPPLEEKEVISILNSVWRYPAESLVDWGTPDFHYSVKENSYKDIPEKLIPDFFKSFVTKKQKALGVPASAIMVCLLTICSAILGATFRIKPMKNTDYEETLNLWGLIIAPPSSRKSPIFKSFQSALDYIQSYFAERRAVFADLKNKNEARIKAEIKNHKGDFDKQAALEADLAAEKNKKVPSWSFFTNDATPEALADLFRWNHRGILYFNDELKGLFALFSKQGYETLRSMLNEAWNGAKSFNSSRIGRGIIDVKSITISVLGAVQPDIIRESFKEELQKGFGGDGLVARFQLCSIYNTHDLKRPDISIDLKKDAREIEAILTNLHEITKSQNIDSSIPKTSLFFSEEGYNLFRDYTEKIDSIQKSDNPSTAYLCHIGKFGRLVLSLSGQFHILDSVLSGKSLERPVEEKWVRLAIEWADFMDQQAKLLYFSINKSNSTKTLISRIKSGDITDGVSVRWIYRKNWSGLQNREDVLNAIENVSESNWISVTTATPKGGGRETEIIRLNPELTKWLNLNKKTNQIESEDT